MYFPSPRKTLLLLWGVAIVVLAGGIHLARQEKQVRVDRDRGAVRDFAAVAHSRLQRLEDLYVDHLGRLARGATADASETGSAADEIAGILEVSLLHPAGAGTPDVHMVITASPEGPPPSPALTAPADPTTPVVLLDEQRLFSHESGWIDEPGKPLMFFLTRSAEQVVVLTVSRPAVERAIREWLGQWADKNFDPVRVTGGPDQLRADGKILAAIGAPESDQPDLLIPLRCRFGSFEVASWDLRNTSVAYHPATLAATGALAVAIALLGIVIFIEQRRAYAVAAQRVSFVNRVSHELRTPLTNILLNIDLAAEMVEDAPEESSRRLGLVRVEARRLGRLIENVLTFSQTEEGQVRLESRACSPRETVSAVIEQFKPSFQRRGLTVERVNEGADALCLCDPDALTQILGNLLSNVEKYVPGGVVKVITRLADERLTIRISDEGPGIPEDAADRIFRPFERIHSGVNEGASGTGLGLAINRDLATRLGGTLLLLSTSSGATFELSVPAPPAPTPAISL